ncbi:MAG: hypothetical protein CDV28_13030 [Candidatus Electronema aureum]|uniref:Uncharacterized protein n=1 Tax=Candidatus Electronema aureum TaxID=2005002 RepID=A0A521FZY0_9BACT|nr:MAG: hypothetical protein CDV28_13030 [Candidatus Electronema aureum]
MERLPMTEKAPVISSLEDTVLKLTDVLNPAGLLRLTGSDLFFDPEDGSGECVIEGTRSGRTVQSRFGPISNSEIILMPDIPSQTEPWNNEYRLSVSTHYTENGSLRTGTYRRLLRAPLAVPLSGHPHLPETGILTDNAVVPHVTVTGGTLTAAAKVRIQALLDVQEGDLRLSLLDMKDNGAAGNEVRVSANDACTLPGYAGSGLTNLEVRINNYAALLKMVRTSYGGRLLDVSAGS